MSENGVSLITKMMKSNPADQITMAMALLHSWVSIQQSTLALGDLNSFTNSVKDELNDISAKKISVTESHKCIPGSIPKSNLENNQPLFNAASISHTKNRNIQSNKVEKVWAGNANNF